ncbi:MAG: HTH-type transcriptional regulator EthR [Deltaproteobacteria bacterium ADurb.BinA179]|jgi:AcrR family transcriptional regulator|nr:MAG: HTH-type transcriptional regulator EthR [Deltaproteobacteria bacterium ADurb.BinA179]HQQ16114.1 TetR/AcrR family transcriptional regulator [Deltaproteobacteria bacterium]
MQKHAVKRIRIPKQQRSVEKKLKIMSTARELFARKGLGGTNSNEIARKAGVSIGTFYSYFPNKKALFLDILREYLESFITGIYRLQSDDAVPLKDNIRSHIIKAFAAFDLHPAFHREALVLKFSDRDVRRLFDDAEQKQLVLISSLLGPYCRPGSGKNLQVAAKVIHSAVENVAHYVKFLDSPIQRELLMDELTEMIYHYVSNL